MIALRIMGFNRNFTVRYSNILSIPVILGALVFLLISENNIFINGFINLNVILVFFLSFLFSLIFIYFLIEWVRKASFFIFAVYRLVFGISILIFYLQF